MLASFSEFKFYQSFRIAVEKADDIRFLVSRVDSSGGESESLDDAQIVDVSITGLGFSTAQRLSVGEHLVVSLHFKRLNMELNGRIVRAFSGVNHDERIIYGVELEEEEELKRFIEQYINSFTPDRLKTCLIDSTLKERYASATEGFEILSLILALFKDITRFSENEDFTENLLGEVCRILNAHKAAIFLIHPDNNELEAFSVNDGEKEGLSFDYRQGIAGSVFTSGVSLNIDLLNDKTRNHDDSLGKSLGTEVRSVICNPLYNREDKVIGVVQVVNKRNEDRFTSEDEKMMKVISLIFSSLFHNYNPISEKSQIRRFSTPFDREHVLIGRTPVASRIRSTIVKLKDIDDPLLIEGEAGVGKTLLARIIHFEGKRGLSKFELIRCGGVSQETLHNELFHDVDGRNFIERSEGGTLFLHHIHLLDLNTQEKLLEVFRKTKIQNSGQTLPVRIVTSSTENLQEKVGKGEFNPDLFQFISQSFVDIEPLRKRKNDVKLLVEYFLKVECKREGLLLKTFTDSAIQSFLEYDWPGNIQELRTCVERAVLYNPKAHVIGDLSNSATPLFDKSKSALRMFDDIPHVDDQTIPLKDRVALVERKMIEAEIRRHNNNKSHAAKVMGISREALRKKLLNSDEVAGKWDKSKKAA